MIYSWLLQLNIICDLHKRLHQIRLLSLSSSHSNGKKQKQTKKKNLDLNNRHKGKQNHTLKK